MPPTEQRVARAGVPTAYGLQFSKTIGENAMRRLLTASALFLFLLVAPTYADSDSRPALFNSEQQAQQHCPGDTIVWLNLPTGVYHFQGQRWYGRTKTGAYVCRKEADVAGDRATRNGQ